MKKSIISLGLLSITCASLLGCSPKNGDNIATQSNADKNPVKVVKGIVARAYKNSLYCNLSFDEYSTVSMLYDTNGRAYVETDYINGFYIDKNRSLTASYDSSDKPYWEILDEYTPLYCVEKGVDLVEKDKGEISEYDGEGADTVYQIDIKGSNIKEFFDELGTQVSDDYCNLLFDKDSLSLTDLDVINIYVMDSPEHIPTFKMDVQTSGGTNTVWNVNGLFETGSITFDSALGEIKNGDDFDKVSEMLNKEKEKIGVALTKYIENHPELKEKIDIKAMESSETASSEEN